MCSFFKEKNGGLDFAQPEVSERDETKIHSMCIYVGMYVAWVTLIIRLEFITYWIFFKW